MTGNHGLSSFVDRGTLARGTDYAGRGLVTLDSGSRIPGAVSGRVRGAGGAVYETSVEYELDAAGMMTEFYGECSCPVATDCKHAVAVVLTALNRPVGVPADRPRPAERILSITPAAAPASVPPGRAAEAEPAESPRSSLIASLMERIPQLFDASELTRPGSGGAAPRSGRTPRPSIRASGAPARPAPPPRPAWMSVLDPLLGPPGTNASTRPPLALGFELTRPGPAGTWPPRSPRQVVAHPGLTIRPLRLGKRDNWIRTGVSWSEFRYDYGRSDYIEEQRSVLAALSRLSDLDIYGGNSSTIDLVAMRSTLLWDLLGRAVDAGIALVSLSGSQPAVGLAKAAAEAALNLDRSGAGLRVEAGVTLDGVRLEAEQCLFLGSPAHGIVTWPGPSGEPGSLALARLDARADPGLLALLAAGPVEVPLADEEEFRRRYLPGLRQRHRVRAADPALLPEEHPARLALAVQVLDGHQIRLDWDWTVRTGEVQRRLSLFPNPMDPDRRDADRERRVLGEAAALLSDLPRLQHGGGRGAAPVAQAVTGGRDTIELVTRVLPRLVEHPDIDVSIDRELPDYRCSEVDPVIELTSSAAPGSTDWFDLTVTITLGGVVVEFAQVFRALAVGDDLMILPDGTYFSLDRDDLRQLKQLIEEARALADRPEGPLRISRVQSDFWTELSRLGVVDEQSRAWLDRVNAWRDYPADSTGAAATPAPADLSATLRPYQLAGYQWLDRLRGNGIGGILADDMGLGKTVQTLAMICQARASDPAGAGFLVVAPTSVLGNWKSEAARFAPHLRVAVITETEARRGVPLEEVAAGADLVITSYTLLRLEADAYQQLPFAGLILDEAQAIKNYQSKSFACVKRLEIPIKFAITGTPMENNLMELWSLFSVVAPGLFGMPGRFNDYYRQPIEKRGDDDLLAQLRRRIAPLLLRRTKEQVALDLPPKQEQVLQLDLEPAHRQVYQRHLQRERQKVLGLLGNLEKNRFAIFRSLTLLRQASIDPYLIDKKHADVASTKLNVLMELLEDVIAGGHRTLVFSQFTGFLARVRARLDAEGIAYCYLDGSTRNRPAVLEEFRTGDAPVFLISLKAGGVGLNLTEADYAILLDPWWNPATEAQAVDRTHRIGQTKKVMVYRLVAKDTIEEKVMALKTTKAKLFAGVLGGGSAGGPGITATDIRALLA